MNFENLPSYIPIIAVQGTILMPGTSLPVPIAEDDLNDLLSDADTYHQLVGVMQPIHNKRDHDGRLSLFNYGTLAHILDPLEITEDFKAIHLSGVCRFEITDNVFDKNGRRYAHVNYDQFLSDLDERDSPIYVDREKLFAALHDYLKPLDINPNWEEIDKTPDKRLLATLTSLCPFEASEKQIILEQPDFNKQTETFIQILSMSKFEQSSIDYMVH